MFRLGEKTYKLVRIGLVRAACPRSLETTPDNLHATFAIRIDANSRKMGGVSRMGFVPSGVIVAGDAMRKRMLAAAMVRGYAFVETNISDIQCDDEISSSELMEKLRVALMTRLMGPNWSDNGCMPGQSYPYIQEVYPFENYMIYVLKGEKYRQHYALDPVAKIVRLLVGSQKVEEKFVDAASFKPKPDVMVQASVERMPLVQTGLRYSPAQVAGNNQTSTRGASHSELVTGLVRDWKNVLKAVAMYLAAIRSGQHKPPMAVPAFAPVNLTPAGKIGQTVAAKGIDVYDFAMWSAKHMAAGGAGTVLAERRTK